MIFIPNNTKPGNLFQNRRCFQQEELTATLGRAKGRGILELGRLGKNFKVVESNPEASTEHGSKCHIHRVGSFAGMGIPLFPWKRRRRKAGDGPSLAGGCRKERPSQALGRKSQVRLWEERVKSGFGKEESNGDLGRKSQRGI